MKIIAVDPSINTIGVAVWIDGTLETRCIHTTGGKKESLVRTLPLYFLELGKDNVDRADALVIEYPNFQTSTRGKIAAQMGYTLDLAFVVGFVARQIPAKENFFPTPNQWKGQCPKEVIGRRFTDWTGMDYNTVTDHEYEAAMMIEWLIRTQTRFRKVIPQLWTKGALKSKHS